MATQENLDDAPLNGGKDDEEILDVAKKRFKVAEEAEFQHRIDAIDDMNFLAGEQWPAAIKNQRALEHRPCLVINRLPQFLSQVTNDQRQNRPSIKVNPVDDKADIDTAKIYQGLIRHIEYNSNADTAYDTSFEASAGRGLGYFRIITDYCDSMSFNQEILIKRIRNPFTVYLDPNYQEPDGSDANWGFVFENMPIEDFKAQFKKAKLNQAKGDMTAIGDAPNGWVTNTTVRVAEYFYKTFESVKIHLLSDGSVVKDKDLDAALNQPQQDPNQPKLTSIKDRMTTLPAIQWVKFSAHEILDKKDWPGQWIPIVPVIGAEIDIDGRRILQGIIRNAKDPQRMINYWNSNATETIALAPRAPFIGAEGQFEGHEEQWNTANTKNHPYMEYKPVDLNGSQAPPPQRQTFEPPIAAMTQMMMHSADDMKATTGIYDPSLGSQRSDHSGIAIQRLNTQAQTGNFHFVDNLSRSIRHGGRIIIDLIPTIYDTASAQRILAEDGQPEIVLLNQIFTDKKDGQQKAYMLGHGKYDCTVGTGPSYATKRQEAAAGMLELSKANPKLMDVAGDIIVGKFDWAGAEEISARLKKTLPPGLADDPKDGQQQIPPQVKQMLDQQKQTIDQLSQHLHLQQNEIDQKSRELESRERIALAQVKAQLELGLAKLQSQSAATMLQHEVDSINARMSLIGESQPLDDEIEPGGGQSPQPNQPPTGGQSPGQPTGGLSPGQNMGS